MPYVEGETLGDRLKREKQLPVDEAVRIATDVAEALHAAHERGVIHRDIKPANILMSNGRPLVADFGIALAVSAAGGGRLTETGLSMGTPYYMSPEQASADREPSAASDVYSLGCVLYEMLVGEPPYTGGSAQAVLAKILMGDAPNPTVARPTIPANVDAAIRKALEKLPADRFAGAHDLARALADPGFRHGDQAAGGVSAQTGSWNRLTMGFAAAAVAFAALAAWAGLRPTPPLPTTRSVMDVEGVNLGRWHELVVSPDGSRFASGGILDGQAGVFWREAAEEEFRLIPGTEGPTRSVSFSPDGLHLAYVTSGGLMRVAISGGAPRAVLSPSDARIHQGTWGSDGYIYFVVNGAGVGLYRVPEAGGPREILLETVAQLFNPRPLPDGKGVLFTDGLTLSTKLFDMETDSVFELIPDGVDATYVETGHLLYSDQFGTLWAVDFDPTRRETTGTPVPVLDDLSLPRDWYARYSVSGTGTIIYGRGSAAGGTPDRLVVVDHDGRAEPLGMAPQEISQVGWAPNGREVVFTSESEGGGDSQVFTYDVELNSLARQLTFAGDNRNPVVSPDGTQVAFASRREGTDGLDLFVKSLVDDVPERLLITLEGDQRLSQWPSDSLMVFQQSLNGRDEIWTLNLSEPGAPVAARYLTGDVSQGPMAVSPDGTLAAYRSRASGSSEIYVSSFPVPGAPTMVSQDGGNEPYWAPDGNTLYYSQPSGGARFTGVQLARNPVPVVLSRDFLFVLGMSAPSLAALHPDGTRWIAAVKADAGDSGVGADRERQILVVNWFTELRERTGGN